MWEQSGVEISLLPLKRHIAYIQQLVATAQAVIIIIILAWDVTVPDTYADSHIADTATMAGAAADKAASTKETKYRQLANSRVFVLVAIER